MAFIELNGAKFFYELQGNGPALILISGYTGDHSLWAQQVGPLSEHFQVLTFDNRAVGQTTDDGCELSAELMADDAMAIADALGLENPHIIGSSMGGTIAQQVALRHPGKINKLGLMVTSAKWRIAMLTGLLNGISMREADVPFDIQFDAILGLVFGEKFLSNPESVAFLKQLILDDPHPQSLEDLKRQAKVLTAFDSRDQVANIKAETLVMNGSEDIISLPYESEYLASQIAGAKQHTFPCGHAVPAEAPEETVKVILDFFK